MGLGLKRFGVVSAALFTLLVTLAGIEPSVTGAQAPDAPAGEFRPHTIEDVAHGPGFGEAEADVLRLYQAFFSREPDVDGALFWLRRFDDGASLASIADGFAQGPEFSSVYGSLDDEAFVDTVYANVLGRSSDAAGRQFWIDELAAGRNRGSVVTLIAGAVEFEDANPFPVAPAATVDDLLRAPQFDGEHAAALRLYQAFLGRAPDVDGASFWTGEVESGRSIESITEAFAASAEFEALAGADDDAAFVERIYQNVLGRSPDGEGSAFWVGELAAGRSRASVVAEFAGSPEFVANNPFQMAGIESLFYQCGDTDGDDVVLYSGADLDRLSEREALSPFGFNFSKAWLEPVTYAEFGFDRRAIATPPLSVEPPHLLPRFRAPCRPEILGGVDDGGWLDRSLRRQQDGPPQRATSLECMARDDVTGPVVEIHGVESGVANVDIFIDDQYVRSAGVNAKTPLSEAIVRYEAERGILLSNAIVAIAPGGGPGDQFDVSIAIGDGPRADCGRAGRIATLPEPDESWFCRASLDGSAARVDYSTPSFLFDQVLRDGEPIVEFTQASPLDPGAIPGQTHTYQLRFTGDGQPATFMDCGMVTMPPDTPENRILAAEAIFNGLPPGPYLYGTVNVTEPGTVLTFDIAMSVINAAGNGTFDYGVTVFDENRNEVFPLLPGGHPGIVPIDDVYGLLLSALDEGRSVEFEFTPQGVPVRWTIDGRGNDYQCLERDTAPLELRPRDKPWCTGAPDSFGTLIPRP